MISCLTLIANFRSVFKFIEVRHGLSCDHRRLDVSGKLVNKRGFSFKNCEASCVCLNCGSRSRKIKIEKEQEQHRSRTAIENQTNQNVHEQGYPFEE